MKLVAPNFHDWRQRTTGDGIITVSPDGSSVIVENGSAGNEAILYWPMVGFPGDRLRFTCMARKNAGTTFPRVAIDSPSGAATGSYLTSYIDDWVPYTVEYGVPLRGDSAYASGIRELCPTIGFGTTGTGHAEFTRPQFELISGQSGGLRTLAMGLLQINTDNTIEFVDNYSKFGFAEPSISSGVISMSMTQPIDLKQGRQYGRLPQVFVWPTSNSQSGNPIIFGVEGFSDSDGSFSIRGFKTTDGALVTDYSGVGGSGGIARYVNVRVDCI